MFFAVIIALPILTGLLAGTFSPSRLPAHVVAALLVYGGWFARAGRPAWRRCGQNIVILHASSRSLRACAVTPVAAYSTYVGAVRW